MAGTFRRDLYFRIRTFELELPPLRKRAGDVAVLARHFVDVHAARLERPAPRIEPGALEILAAHEWPGNVRELESLILRALVQLSPGESLTAAEVQALLPHRHSPRGIPDDLLAGRTFREWRREAERAYVVRLLRETRGNPSRVMEALGIKRSQLYALLGKLGIDRGELRREPADR